MIVFSFSFFLNDEFKKKKTERKKEEGREAGRERGSIRKDEAL